MKGPSNPTSNWQLEVSEVSYVYIEEAPKTNFEQEFVFVLSENQEGSQRETQVSSREDYTSVKHFVGTVKTYNTEKITLQKFNMSLQNCFG